MFGFLLGEALRDLRRAGRVAVSAIMLITLSLAALGAFWLLSSNLGQAVAQFRERVKIVVYLKRELPATEANALAERVRRMPGVASVRYVGKAEALGTLRQVLGKDASVADSLPQNPLPASLEITPTDEGSTLEGARALVTRLAALPESDEIGGGVDWIERFAHGQRLLWVFGLGVGAVLALAAILTVTTATTLVLHARRDEMEIMRLVGAPEHVVRMPLLLQGMMQGLMGAVLAVWVLIGCYALLGPRLEPLVSEVLGVARLAFLPPLNIVALMLAGTLLGGDRGPAGPRAARGMSASPRLLTALVVVVAVTTQAGAQAPPAKKTEDPIQTEQRKLRQTEEKLKEERRKAAEARAKETSLLAELDQVEQRLADKQRDIGADRRADQEGAGGRGRRPDRDPGPRTAAGEPGAGPGPPPAGRLQGPRPGGCPTVTIRRGRPGGPGGRGQAPDEPGDSGRPFDPGVSWNFGPIGRPATPGRNPAARAGRPPI